MRLVAHVEGVGVAGPGLADWPAARAVLAGESPWLDAPTVVPAAALLAPNERRRAGALVRASLAVAEAATAMSGRDPAALPSVFTSSSGDGANCHAICEVLASADRSISPTRFHNSVHNAPAGYWTIGTRSMAASTSLCAFDASFAAGLLEAAAQLATGADAVLLVAADSRYPEPLNSVRPIRDAFGLGLVLAREPGPRTIAILGLALAPADATTPARALDDAMLDALRQSIPAARGLPLLRAIARAGAEPQRVAIDYLDTLDLVATVRA